MANGQQIRSRPPAASVRHVVVVGGLSETVTVLKAVLEPRGLQVTRIRTRRPGDGIPASGEPHVVVVHGSNDPELGAWKAVPRVVIGTADEAAACASRSGEVTHFLSKPFQYPDLIRVIEQLLKLDA